MKVVERVNYIPNTLRRNRVQAFEQDIDKLYNKYLQVIKSIPPEQITISIFSQLWGNLNLQYIFQCLCEEESQEEFAQMMYEVVLKSHFFMRDKTDKVFALFALYFLYFACENRKRINICMRYLSELKDFVLENRNEKVSHYMKIAFHLHQKCFNVCTKIGMPNPIVKGSGQVPRKHPVVGINPMEQMTHIEDQLREWNNPDRLSLRQSMSRYDKLKKQLLRDGSISRQKFPSDTYFVNRIDRQVKNYKEFVQTTEALKKKQQEMQ